MTIEYEHKVHELKILEESGDPEHPLIVQTRDGIHQADLSYALTKGHLIGEPADLALNRDQLNWIKKMDSTHGLQKKYYGQVYEVPPPVTPEAALAAAEANVKGEPVPTPAAQRAVDLGRHLAQVANGQAGPVTDLRDGWMAAVAAGETTEGFDQWSAQRSVTGYMIDAAAFETLRVMLGDQVAGQFKPIYEVKS